MTIEKFVRILIDLISFLECVLRSQDTMLA